MVESAETVKRISYQKDESKIATDQQSDQNIRRQIEETVYYYARYPDQIDLRLEELDREWDIDQMLQAHLSALSILGLVVGAMGRRGWFLLPIVGCAVLLQHTIRGWSPPVELLRRFGIRNKREIMREHYALRALRGDFDPLCETKEMQLPLRVDTVLKTVW